VIFFNLETKIIKNGKIKSPTKVKCLVYINIKQLGNTIAHVKETKKNYNNIIVFKLDLMFIIF